MSSQHYLYFFYLFFFFNAPATTEIYTLSLHDALPIYDVAGQRADVGAPVPAYLGLVVHAAERHAHEFAPQRSEEHTSELQSRLHLVCRLLLEKKKKTSNNTNVNRHIRRPARLRGLLRT